MRSLFGRARRAPRVLPRSLSTSGAAAAQALDIFGSKKKSLPLPFGEEEI